jgi:putative membrane protein
VIERALAVLAFWWLANSARAHGPEELAARSLLRAFTPNYWVLGCVSVASLLYARGQREQQARALGPTRSKRESSAFVLAMFSLLLALISPLDRLSDILFSAHMVQHELLMLVAAPLLVLARPLPTYLCALPTSWRLRVGGALRSALLTGAARALGAPFVALVLHGLVRWLWHLPAAFEAALANEWIHGLQHASFFATALLFWWSLLQGRYGRAGYGAAVLFVLLTSLHTGALGALLALADGLWYPTYAAQAQRYQIDALLDQELAGLVMWVAAGVWLMLLALALLLAWLGEARRRARHGSLATLRRAAARGPS